MGDDASIHLVSRWRAGDQRAADELFRRYAEQLVGLTRRRLSAKLAHRIDPQDVVQSVYRSFFSGALAGRYDLQRGGDLWRLLVGITLHKLYRQIERLKAAKRAFDREQALGGDDNLWGIPAEILARGPSPLEAVALADELEQFMSQLEPVHRRMLELRLQGYGREEIAAQTERSERTVRRVLERIKQQLDDWPGRQSTA
jgi:RNA polymerase sigma factor (sigma-70 family)